ncbi:hypothetical protein GJ496_003054 [Pomphorhynchus laevis]|nr:hypothetical protein GJ496_003054 [Pomphorhynchus laevis]
MRVHVEYEGWDDGNEKSDEWNMLGIMEDGKWLWRMGGGRYMGGGEDDWIMRGQGVGEMDDVGEKIEDWGLDQGIKERILATTGWRDKRR